MTTYLISKGDWSQPREFDNIEDAKSWALANVGKDCTVIIAGLNDQIKPISEAEKLSNRQTFGKELLNQYLMDNDAIAAARGYPFTIEETVQQATKFQLVMGILPLGSLKQCLTVITNTAIDTIFTQTRKDAYILALNNYINNQ